MTTLTTLTTLIKTAFLSLCSLIVAFTIVSLFALYQPGYSAGKVQFSDGTSTEVVAPQFNQYSPTPKCTLDFSMNLPLIHATRFKCCGVTALESLTINNHPIAGSKLQKWPASSGYIADLFLDEYLQTGENHVQAQFRDGPAYITFYLLPSNKDPWTLGLIFFLTLIVFLAIKGLAILFPSLKITASESVVFILGCLIRLMYMANTAYFFRSYDVERGHLSNLLQLSQNWTFPTSTQQSLEFFQPPLYYYLAAASTYLAKELGACTNSLATTWEAETCFLSMVTLALCIIIKRLLFKKEQRWQSNFFLCYMAVFPTLVYDANCISNDSLFCTLSFAWLALLLSIWSRISRRKWIFMSVLLGLGLITKGNTIPLVVITFLLLLVTKQITGLAKSILLIVASLIMLLTAGWVYIPRAVHSTSALTLIVNNIETIGKGLAMTPTLETFTTFDPFSIVQHPIASQVPATDPRRMFFWEYFFKTAFSGENFFWPSDSGELQLKIIELTAMSLLPLTFWGFARRLRKFSATSFPLVVLLPLQCIAEIAYVLQAPFVCNQHFRFSTIIVVPLTYFSLKGIEQLPVRYRFAGQTLFVILTFTCAWLALLLGSEFSTV